MKILFICTGNLCRSPMAEALMRAELSRRGCTSFEVASAGTWAHFGNPATPDAIGVVGESEIDLSGHRSRPLDPAELAEADLVVAMTSVHVREILSMDASVERKVVLLKQLLETEVASVPGAGPEERLEALLAGRKPQQVRAHDLDDPMSLPYSAYERAFRELKQGIERLADLLCG